MTSIRQTRSRSTSRRNQGESLGSHAKTTGDWLISRCPRNAHDKQERSDSPPLEGEWEKFRASPLSGWGKLEERASVCERSGVRE